MKKSRKRKPRRLMNSGLLTLLTVLSLGLSACGAASRGSEANYMDMAPAAAEASYDSDSHARASAAGKQEAMETAAEQGSGVSESSLLSEESYVDTKRPTDSMDKKLIRNVELSFETESFNSFLKNLEDNVDRFQGYVENSEVNGNTEYEKTRHAYYTLRIPAKNLDAFLDSTESEGQLTRKYESTQDVTLNYHDTELRKKTLETEQARLLELLSRADSMEAVIALESRLSDIRYQLDSFESELRRYDNQVTYSTVHMDIHETRVLTAGEKAGFTARVSQGLRRNLQNLSEGFVNTAVFLLSSLPQLLLLLLVIVCFLLIMKRLRKKRARAKQQETASEGMDVSAIKEQHNDSSEGQKNDSL